MKTLLRVIGSVVFSVASFGLVLFGPAGTLHWTRGWVMIGVAAVASAFTVLFGFRCDDQLFRERRRGLFQKGQPLADKLVLGAFMAAFGLKSSASRLMCFAGGCSPNQAGWSRPLA